MKCTIQDCNKPHCSKGYCLKHYANFKRTGDPIPKVKPHRNPLCSVPDCGLKHRRNGYCEKHSARKRRHGDTTAVHPNKQSPEERYAKLKIRQKIYDQTTKGKAASVLKRHRRRHLEGEVTLTAKDVEIIMEKFDYQCFKCYAKRDLTLDHHIPLIAGGKLEPSNVVILCRKCNGIKAGKAPEEFYDSAELALLKIFC